jgi:hypothetical protein
MFLTLTTMPPTSAPAELSPSTASLHGLDGVSFFIGDVLAGFGPYVAVYLADQKWTQEKIGFVLTASGLAGLLALSVLIDEFGLGVQRLDPCCT